MQLQGSFYISVSRNAGVPSTTPRPTFLKNQSQLPKLPRGPTDAVSPACELPIPGERSPPATPTPRQMAGPPRGPHPATLSAHLPSPRPRSPIVTGHRALSESPRVADTLSNESAFHPEPYLCQTLNKSSRKQTKSKLLPALCPGPDLPKNREF